MSASKPSSPAIDKFALDTSCLIALLSEWHDKHRVTRTAYESRLKRGRQLVVPAHAALECFSVLTRLPGSLSASPDAVEHALTALLPRETDIAGISGADCRVALHELARRGIGGGRIYDGIIALCSFQAGARELLTLNLKHFLAVAPTGLSVVEPS